jgi:hypothetical protein
MESKYLKYKNKYLSLKKQLGGMKPLAIITLERILNAKPDDGSYDPIHTDVNVLLDRYEHYNLLHPLVGLTESTLQEYFNGLHFLILLHRCCFERQYL